MADFGDVMAQRPQVIVCNVEFLSSKKVAKGFIVTLKLLGLLFQVRDVILDLSLPPSGRRAAANSLYRREPGDLNAAVLP